MSYHFFLVLQKYFGILQGQRFYVLVIKMFHYFQGKIQKNGVNTLLVHDFLGIQICYAGNKEEGEFYLFPYYDDNKKTIQYYAFDSLDQKLLFEKFLKVNGVGTKTAFQIAQMSQDELSNAVKNMDVKFFQTIPGIGPKSAKKILLELKDSLDVNQISSLDIDQKLFKDIVKSMRGFGYDADSVKKVLLTYKEPITRETIPKIVKRIISQL